jgi:hypothetical protein
MLYINCKTCDSLTVGINVNYSILSCLIIIFLLCIVTNWKNWKSMMVKSPYIQILAIWFITFYATVEDITH